jgi:hypothetical protein
VGFFFCFLFGLLSHTCTSFSYTESNFTFCFLQEKAPYINKASQKKTEYVKTLAAYKQKQVGMDGDHVSSSTESAAAWEAAGRPLESMSPRDRIQLFRHQISGKVNIPETWPGEEKLKDWACHSDVEDALRPLGLMLATTSLVKDSLSRHV